MTIKSGKSVYLQAVAIIDPATGWIEIGVVPSLHAKVVAYQVELAWMIYYPLPRRVKVDKGDEFLIEPREIIINDYSIK